MENLIRTITQLKNTMKTSTVNARLWRTAFVLLLSLTWGAPSAFAAAAPPERLTYQGYLVDANGTALGNAAPKNFNVTFRIFDKHILGVNKWSEQQTVTVDKGYFSVLLGEGTAVGSEPRPVLSAVFNTADADERYVEMTVKGIANGGGDTTIAPRLRLLTAPFAFLAKQASQLVNANGTPILGTDDSTDLTIQGNMKANKLIGSSLEVTGELKAGSLNIPNLKFPNGATFGGTGGSSSSFDQWGSFTTGGSITAGAVTMPRGAALSWEQGMAGGIQSTHGMAGYPSLNVWGHDGIAFNARGGNPYHVKIASVDADGFYIYQKEWNGQVNTQAKVKLNAQKDYGSLEVYSYRTDGTLQFASYNWNGSWYNLSDRRLKTNIVGAEGLLDRVMAVQMRRFRMKSGDPQSPLQLGVIAQELQPLFPDMIMTNNTGNTTSELPESVLSVNSSGFGTIAIKAIQELKQEKDKEIAELRQANAVLKLEKDKETADLKKEISLLKAKVDVASTQEDRVTQLVQQLARLEKLVASGGKPGLPTEVISTAASTGAVAK